MPPGRRGRRGSGFAGVPAGRGQPIQTNLLGKRRGGPDGQDIIDNVEVFGIIGDDDFNIKQHASTGVVEKQHKRQYENQSSFANFMVKKGAIIDQLLEEKSEFIFKSPEWLEKKEKQKRFTAKHTKNLKQICGIDQFGEQLGSYQSIDGGISVKKPNKYCDFTGFHTNYQDPKTSLRYYNIDFYQVVRGLPEGAKNDHLAIRKANVVLR
ncbi:UNKNOWN [Stylonychia lemnae]|uniref:Vps72/YL1 C-terminal domain-containing protein n=1 Tax=Stylonychia lemnae TaxID=5949 RepID=A0A078A4W1_STYLE|nr:UNKNOWN [Stylonychia lemnae]|eukprot:CDW76879.1 UNKNOWN [Stylonychia lemnae]